MKKKIDSDLKNIHCSILPTRPLAPFKDQRLLNKTFTIWKECWVKVADNVGFPFIQDDFYRQNAVLVLQDSIGEVIGCHLYSFYNLESLASTESIFFSKFNTAYIDYLKNNGLTNTFSMEYLTVVKPYRRCANISYAKLISSLSCKVLEHSSFHGVIAQTRDDRKINAMGKELGAEIVQTGFLMNGIESSFISFKKGNTRLPNDKNFVDHVENIWESRTDHTELTTKEQIEIGFKQRELVA